VSVSECSECGTCPFGLGFPVFGVFLRIYQLSAAVRLSSIAVNGGERGTYALCRLCVLGDCCSAVGVGERPLTYCCRLTAVRCSSEVSGLTLLVEWPVPHFEAFRIDLGLHADPPECAESCCTVVFLVILVKLNHGWPRCTLGGGSD
jgi:hypothetical protein